MKEDRERALNAKAPALWNELRSIIQDACASFNQHYCQNGREVSCTVEDGRRILVTHVRNAHTANPERFDVVVEYNNHFHRIRCSEAEYSPLEFAFEYTDDGTVYLIELDTDDRSERSLSIVSDTILQPVLFPEQ
jgi:hypothetical protein